MKLLDRNTNTFIELNNGKTVQITTEVHYEIDYDFDASHEIPEIQRQLEADEIVPLIVKVSARMGSVVVEDYLGAIFADSSTSVAHTIIEAIEDTGLRREVVQQLKAELDSLLEKLGA